MTSKSKAKGNGFERELVDKFKEHGFKAKRAWGSNGQAMGEHEEVDVLVTYCSKEFNIGYKAVITDNLKLQCKRRKKIPTFLGLTEHVDASIFREDKGTTYIMFSLETFIRKFMK